MRGPGDSWINADNTFRIPALFQLAPYIWDAQSKPIPVPQVTLVESVDRHYQQLFSRRVGCNEPKSEK